MRDHDDGETNEPIGTDFLWCFLFASRLEAIVNRRLKAVYPTSADFRVGHRAVRTILSRKQRGQHDDDDGGALWAWRSSQTQVTVLAEQSHAG
jgi:hypothetical protein